jgi:hypothetical protein
MYEYQVAFYVDDGRHFFRSHNMLVLSIIFCHRDTNNLRVVSRIHRAYYFLTSHTFTRRWIHRLKPDNVTKAWSRTSIIAALQCHRRLLLEEPEENAFDSPALAKWLKVIANHYVKRRYLHYGGLRQRCHS